MSSGYGIGYVPRRTLLFGEGCGNRVQKAVRHQRVGAAAVT